MRFLKTAALGALLLTLVANTASAQVEVYTWNNSGSDITAASNYTSSPATTLAPYNTDGIQFTTAPAGAAAVNPVLTADNVNGVNNSTNPFTVSELTFGNSSTGGNYTLSGTGSVASGPNGNLFTVPIGLLTRGSGTTTINLGDGTNPSLILGGSAPPSGSVTLNGNTGGLDVGGGSTLLLTGKTIATLNSGTDPNGNAVAPIAVLHGGTLVIDSTSGDAASAVRLSIGTGTSGAAQGQLLLIGGGTLEVRGSTLGTAYTGFTNTNLNIGGGDNYVRTVAASPSAALNVTFNQFVPNYNTSTGVVYFENVGTGFVGDASNNTRVTFANGIGNTTNIGNGIFLGGNGIVTNRATATSTTVTGRFGTLDTNNNVVAGATQSYTTSASLAAGNEPTPQANSLPTGVLFNPTAAGSYTYGLGSVQSVVLEPGAAGVTLDVSGTSGGSGSGGFVTKALLLSGANSITVTGTNLFAASGKNVLSVLSPGAVLSTNASFNLNSSGGTLILGGQGTVSLTGTTNQIGTAAGKANIIYLNGILRGTTANLVLAPTAIRFGGGILEFDSGSATGTSTYAPAGAGSTSGSYSFNLNAFNQGGGGFSSYQGTLTVALGGTATPTALQWDNGSFIRDGFALKFGTLASGGTVVFQNAIALDGAPANPNIQTTYAEREFNVTRGTGSAADRTQLTGVISGSATTDFLKTGTGVLELAGNNTYQGNTIVNGGTLVATNATSSTGTGSVIVGTAGTLGGTGAIAPAAGNGVSVYGTLAPGNPTAALTGVLTVGASGMANSVTFKSGSTFSVALNGRAVGTGANNTGYDQLNVLGSGTITLTGATLAVQLGYAPLALDRLDILQNQTGGALVGTFSGLAQGATVSLGNGTTAQISYTGSYNAGVPLQTGGNDVVLYNFATTATPEPGHLLALCALALGLVVAVRRRRLA